MFLLNLAPFLLTIGYVVLGHLSPRSLFPLNVDGSIMLWLGLAAGVACLPSLLRRPAFWSSPYGFLMIGLMAAAPISRIEKTELDGAFAALRDIAASSMVVFLVIAAVNTPRRLRVFGIAIALTAVYLLAQSIHGVQLQGLESQFIVQQRFEDQAGAVIGRFPRLRSVGIFEDPNDFAQFLAVGASLLPLAWISGRWIRNAAFVLLPMTFLVYGVYATHSRGGLIGIALMVFLLVANRFSRKAAMLVAVVMLTSLLAAQAAGPRALSLVDTNAMGRVQAWQAGIGMLKASPLFGVGYRLFEQNNAGFSPHNTFVQCFAELGVFGYFFWLGLIVFSLADLNRILRNRQQTPQLARVAGVLRTALLVFLATAVFLSRTYVMTLYLLIGMSVALRLALQQPAPNKPVMYPSRWGLTAAAAVVSILIVQAAAALQSI